VAIKVLEISEFNEEYNISSIKKEIAYMRLSNNENVVNIHDFIIT
jgi:hypothetical protein